MSFITKNDNLEKLRQAAVEEAQKYNITGEIFDKKFEETKEHFRNTGCSEDELDYRAYRKIIVGMKKRARNNSVIYNGVLFYRKDLPDFASNERKAAQKFLKENGIDEAIAAGYVNEKGQPLYKKDLYRKGVIPSDTRSSLYLGLLQKSDSNKAEIFEVYANREKVETEIPLFTKVALSVSPSNKKNRVYFNSFDGKLDDLLNIDDFVNYLQEIYKDKLVDFDSLSLVSEKLKRGDWVITQAHITSEGVIKSDQDMVPVEAISTDVTSDEYGSFWAYKSIFKDLPNLEEKDVLLFLHPFIYTKGDKEGTLGGTIFGICPEVE